MNDRFDWFKCYPDRMLKASIALNPNETLIYWTVIFRIYSLDGPCPDTPAVLARRTGLGARMVQRAINSLLKTGKLYRVDGGIMETVALEQLIERNNARSQNPMIDVNEPLDQSKKSKQKQQNGSQRQRQKEERETNLPFGQIGPRASIVPVTGIKLIEWTPSEKDASFGIEQNLTAEEISREAEKFRNHYTANGVEGFVNPSARFRNWLVNASVFKARDAARAEAIKDRDAKRAGRHDGPDFYDVAMGRFER